MCFAVTYFVDITLICSWLFWVEARARKKRRLEFEPAEATFSLHHRSIDRRPQVRLTFNNHKLGLYSREALEVGIWRGHWRNFIAGRFYIFCGKKKGIGRLWFFSRLEGATPATLQNRNHPKHLDS